MVLWFLFAEAFDYKIPACSVQVIRIGMKAK